MTELLQPQPGERVLEIGTGSGYQAAILAELGFVEVYSIEIVPELAETAAARLKALGYEEVHVRQGDGYYGWPDAAPFNSWIDRMCLALAVLGQALPNFFFALLLIMAFSISLRWLPVSGSGTWQHFVMQTIALGYYAAPAFMRLIRAGMIEVLEADYIRTARAKGLPANKVIFKHALRNAVVPVVALAAVQLGFLLGGSVVIETIFALDGLGYLAYQSITFKDFPVMQNIVLLLSVIYVVLTLASDIANAWLDPRIRVA